MKLLYVLWRSSNLKVEAGGHRIRYPKLWLTLYAARHPRWWTTAKWEIGQ